VDLDIQDTAGNRDTRDLADLEIQAIVGNQVTQDIAGQEILAIQVIVERERAGTLVIVD
jgi:hypothetical protein